MSMEMKPYKVKDVVSRVIDNRGRNADYFENEKYPIIDNYMIKNMLHPDLNTATRFLSEEQFQNFLRGYIKENDLLITLVGGIGNVSLAPHSTCAIVQNTIGLTFKEENCDSNYAYYYFKTIQYAIRNLNRGISQPSVNREDILGLKLWLPKIGCQRRIAQVLLAYDNLIEVNNKRIKVLEQMAENLYKEWFVRFRFPGHETAEFENGLPKGWEYCSVESLSSVLQRGISPDYDDDGELTVISQKCIRQNIMDIREARRQNKTFKAELNIKDGDTVICSTGTGTLGRVGQVYGEYPNTTFDSHVTLIRSNVTIGKHYLYWTLKEMQPWFMNMGIGSTNQQELYRGTIKNAKALKPNPLLAKLFENTIDPIHKSIIMLIKKQENLTRQRDLLLPRLMSGKLEV